MHAGSFRLPGGKRQWPMQSADIHSNTLGLHDPLVGKKSFRLFQSGRAERKKDSSLGSSVLNTIKEGRCSEKCQWKCKEKDENHWKNCYEYIFVLDYNRIGSDGDILLFSTVCCRNLD